MERKKREGNEKKLDGKEVMKMNEKGREVIFISVQE